jgi:TM2 domain-containing membrane protein YozV
MFCRNGGKQVNEKAIACVACGVHPLGSNNFCQNCGAETNAAAVMCVKCGVSLQAATATAQQSGAVILPSNPPKDVVLMCVLSVLLPGLGQIVLGQVGKGIVLLAGPIAFYLITCGFGFLLAPVVWIVAAVDAYKIANKLRGGKPVRRWEFF